jgi:hypothetical protein
MKTIEITCQAQAVIEERWIMTVPDDFDVTDEDAVFNAFFDTHAHPGVATNMMDEHSIDEQSRDITEWTVQP